MMSEKRFLEYMNKVDEKTAETKRDTETLIVSTLKKFEIRVDDLVRHTDDSINKGLEKFQVRVDGLATKIYKVIKDNAEHKEVVTKEFVNIMEQVNSLQTMVTEQQTKYENKIGELEHNIAQLSDSVSSASPLDVQKMKDSLAPIINDQVSAAIKVKTDEILPSLKSTWNCLLAQKVWEHEHSVIVFGCNTNKPLLETANELLRINLQVNDENVQKISIKKVIRLGKLETGKTPPLLVTLGHPSKRNLILSHSKNLRNSSISLRKYVPKIYHEEYKKFEDKAFKLRNMPGLNYQTQIVFDGHFMLLRTKLPDTVDDKYHYTTYWQFEPPMGLEPSQVTSLKNTCWDKSFSSTRCIHYGKGQFISFLGLKRIGN